MYFGEELFLAWWCKNYADNFFPNCHPFLVVTWISCFSAMWVVFYFPVWSVTAREQWEYSVRPTHSLKISRIVYSILPMNSKLNCSVSVLITESHFRVFHCMTIRIDSLCTSVFAHSPWLEQDTPKNVLFNLQIFLWHVHLLWECEEECCLSLSSISKMGGHAVFQIKKLMLQLI